MKLSYLGRVFLCQSWQLLVPAALLNASVKKPTWPSSHLALYQHLLLEPCCSQSPGSAKRTSSRNKWDLSGI